MWISFALGMLLLIAVAFLWNLLRGRNKKRPSNDHKLNIAFVHLDLGIGGAERLVVDAACSLQDLGHKITIYTTHHPERSFPETKEILKVQVHGHFLPHQLAFFAKEIPDVIFCDGVSACLPILKLTPGAKIMFYCHFPDLLLTRKKSFIRTLYRFPMNLLEEYTTAMADVVVVNSKFTGETFKKTFTRIKTTPEVVYPCVSVSKFDELIRSLSEPKNKGSLLKLPSDKQLFVSINRFDPNKKIDLAIEAFIQVTKAAPNNYQLICAGGYDPSVPDNVNCLEELRSLVQKNGSSFEVLSKTDRTTKWTDKPIVFLTDVSEIQKIQLLKSCLVLLYTPSNEHFGIVPVEAMLSECPVIGVKSGGLLESVTTDRTTGFLCEPTAADFATAMKRLMDNPSLPKELGRNGRQRVIAQFSLERLGAHLNEIMQSMVGNTPSKKKN